MARQLFANNIKTTLSSGLSNVATTMDVTSVAGFPTIGASTGDWYLLTIEKPDLTNEIVQVTANPSGTTLPTIVRAQEGTTALTFLAGQAVELRDTAGTLRGLQQPHTIGASFDGTGFRLTLTATTKVRVGPVKFQGRITAVTVVLDASGSVTLGVKKCTRTSYPGSLTDITAGANVVVSGAAQFQDTTLTSWTTTVAIDDVFQFQLIAVDGTIQQATILLTVE